MSKFDAMTPEDIRAHMKERERRRRERARRRATQPHFVYRAYAEDGTLLYVGCTSDLHARMQIHKSRSPWFPQAVRLRVSEYPDFRTAYRVEARAIASESPRFNVSPVESARRGWETRRRRIVEDVAS